MSRMGAQRRGGEGKRGGEEAEDVRVELDGKRRKRWVRRRDG